MANIFGASRRFNGRFWYKLPRRSVSVRQRTDAAANSAQHGPLRKGDCESMNWPN